MLTTKSLTVPKTDNGERVEYTKMWENIIEGTRQIDLVTSGEEVAFLKRLNENRG